MKHPGRAVARAVAAATFVLVTFGQAGPANAHERRDVGPYEFVVGFLVEPAFASEPNAVSLSISTDGEPFVDLTDTLDVEVRFGDESMRLTMRPLFRVDAFGTPGEYGAEFMPTRPGTYTFHFLGDVGGVEVDEEFTSGPGTFNDVQDPSSVAFPVSDPSTGQLADRLAGLEEDSDDSGDTTAVVVAVVALVAAVASLALSGWIMLRRR